MIIPTLNYVLIELDPPTEKTSEGIYTTEKSRQSDNCPWTTRTIVKLNGLGGYYDKFHNFIKYPFKEGDKVMFSKFEVQRFYETECPDKMFLILHVGQVAVIIG
jgi:co-chaperonin GroES (HSP10)